MFFMKAPINRGFPLLEANQILILVTDFPVTEFSDGEADFTVVREFAE